MTPRFDAALDGPQIRCTLTVDEGAAGAVWCFSLMAPGRVVSGGTMLRRVAGYCEVALPDLSPESPHEVILAHENPDWWPRNRAWLPLGGYLRLADGRCVSLPVLPAGVLPLGPAPVADPWPGLRLIPQPQLWEPAGGTLSGPFAGTDPTLRAVDALAARTGLPSLLGGTTPLQVTAEDSLPPEGYRLTVTATEAKIAHADPAGLFHAGVTLITLMATHGAIPCGRIEDAPRFGWRGQHMDCARHFVEMPTLNRLLDLMALLKLNRFHWHFADDEAFRLEVDCAPALWRKTAYRGEGLPIPGVFGGGIRSGGSYSKADAHALIARGAELHIAILPEIEVPAHGYAINAAIGGLRDPGDNGSEISIQGYPLNTINPAMPATWDLVLPLAEEVAALFPLNILHLGCDELPPATWDGSPLVTELKAREGLTDRDDVQGWMMARIAGHLAARGIRSAAWEEALKGAQGGIGHGALLFSWTGQGAGVEAARAGHDVVMCPAQNVYLDLAHSDRTEDWGARWAGTVALEDTVAWDPVPKGAEDIAPRVAGVEGTFWGEFTTQDREIEAMLAPRILGVAQMGWGAKGAVDGRALRAIAAHYGVVFDAMGWDWHRSA